MCLGEFYRKIFQRVSVIRLRYGRPSGDVMAAVMLQKSGYLFIFANIYFLSYLYI